MTILSRYRSVQTNGRRTSDRANVAGIGEQNREPVLNCNTPRLFPRELKVARIRGEECGSRDLQPRGNQLALALFPPASFFPVYLFVRSAPFTLSRFLPCTFLSTYRSPERFDNESRSPVETVVLNAFSTKQRNRRKKKRESSVRPSVT